MAEFWASLSGLETFYLGCAIIGGMIFLIRLILALIGMEAGGDVDVDHDLDMDHDFDADHDFEAEHADSDASFQLISLQTLSGFVLMFGMVGLSFTRSLPHVMEFISIGPALVAGVFTMWIIAKLMSALYKLQSSGTLDVKNAIGAEGTVYMNIPAGGTGKVQVNMQNRLVEWDAVSENGEALKTGDSIRVVFMKGDTLVVEKV